MGQPAPAAPPPPVPAPLPVPGTLDATFAFTPPEKPEEHESIFTAPTQTDDLFGQSAARIEMPTEPINPSLPHLEMQPPAVPAAIPAPQENGTVPFMNLDATQPLGPPQGETIIPHVLQPAHEPAAAPWMQPTPSGPVESDVPVDAATAAILAKPRSRSGWHIALFIIPLISYALLATVAVIILWKRLQEQPPHPLIVVPDVEGEHPTPSKKPSGKLIIPRPRPGQKLPNELVTSLGKPIDLGELEVVPLEIVRGDIAIGNAKKDENAQTLKDPALKLKLRFKNRSNDLSFYPMDRFFTRYWLPGGKNAPDGLARWMPADKEPYTMLEVGGERFYGGPAGYRPPGKTEYENEYVIGQDFDEILEPGKELTTFVCTDAQDPKLLQSVQKFKGTMLWRVQVRRGSIMVEGRRKPCTAVIGVEFTADDIKDEKKG
jgi:hypothetical protein